MENKVAFNTGSGVNYFSADEIIRLEATSNYTWVHFLAHKPLLLTKVLKEFEPVLLPLGFLRTHRSHLVNKNKVVKIANNNMVVMNDESIAAISRRRRRQVIRELSVT